MQFRKLGGMLGKTFRLDGERDGGDEWKRGGGGIEIGNMDRWK